MKYKYATSDKKWFIQIYDDGTKSQSFTEKNRPGQYAEMEAWKKIPGNEIEAAETEDEKEVRLAEEKTQTLESQYQICKNLLDKTQYIVNGDCDYSDEDKEECKTWRAQIKQIMRSNVIQEIPERSY